MRFDWEGDWDEIFTSLEFNRMLGDGVYDFQIRAKARDHHLAKWYIFGDKILDAKFCNAVVDGFVLSAEVYHQDRKENVGDQDFGGAMVSTETCNELYASTSVGCPIRRYLVDNWVNECCMWPGLDEDDVLHPEFARDLVQALLPRPNRGPYHDRRGVVGRWTWYKPE